MLATFCPVFSDPVWRASAAKQVGDPLPVFPPFPPLPAVVAVAVSVAGAAAASVVVAAAASVVAATSVTAAALELALTPPPPFPPRPPRPPLPLPTLPESASVFVVAIDRTTSAADDIWAGETRVFYFPMQNVPKIRLPMSAVVVVPVIFIGERRDEARSSKQRRKRRPNVSSG